MKNIRPFGFRDKLGYLFGDFGNDFTFILSTVLLMKFYTDVMGVSASAVGTVIMLARFVDAFTDVAMGRICDGAKARRSGKFKPWILRMCIPVAISSFLIYQNSLADHPTWFKIVYLFVTYILWGSVFYTSINIPYGSMASAISADSGDRQSLSTYRTMGGMLAGVLIGVLLPLIAFEEINSKQVLVGRRVTVAAGVFSLLAVICHLLCYFLVSEREYYKAELGKRKSTVGMLLSAVKNRALWSLVAASVVMLLAQFTMQNMAAYVFPDYYGSTAAQAASNIFMLGGMSIAAAVSKPLSIKLGKAEISATASVFAAIVCLVMYLLRPQNVWIYVILQTLCWLGLGIFAMVNWALVTDVIDYSEIESGVREDGSIYAVYSFARKLGQALAAGASGWLLTVIGYSESAASSGQAQTKVVLDGIYNISTLVPAIGFTLLALVLWLWYPLKKRRVEENISKLKGLKGE